MAYSRMSSRGQVTIPEELRRRLGWQPGDRVEFTPGPGKTLVLFSRSRRIGVPERPRRDEASPHGSGVSREELNLLLKDWPGAPRRKVAN